MESTLLPVTVVLSALFQGCLGRCYYYSYSNYCYSYTYYLSGGSVAGVVVGCIIGVAILIALIVACCVKGCCSTQSPGVVINQQQPQAMTVSHVSAAHANPGFVQGYGQNPPPYSAVSAYPVAYPVAYPAPGQQVQYQPPYVPAQQSMQQQHHNLPKHTPPSTAPVTAPDEAYFEPVGSSAQSAPKPGNDDRTYERLQL